MGRGHDFAARSCSDLDLQSSDPNVARDTSSQYGDHFDEKVLKSDFKQRSNGSDTNSGRTDGLAEGRTTRRLYAHPNCFRQQNNLKISKAKLGSFALHFY